MRLVAAAVAAFALAAGPAVAAQCQLVRIAEWPVKLERNRPVIEGSINGTKVGILLDTGSNTTVVARAAAVRLGLERQYVAGEFLGVGGASRVEMTEIEEFRLGQAVRNKWRVLVVGEHDLGDDVAVILGEDFFENVDLELDLGNKVVRLFKPQDCERSPLAYWAANAPRVDMDVGRSIIVPASVNGVPVRAIVDTGATRSFLATQIAAQAGITPSSPGVTSGGCIVGFGKKRVDGWIAPMKQFSLGGETVHNPHVGIADMAAGAVYQEIGSHIAKAAEPPVMLLGVDFLLAHRVFVAHSQRAMYFTHNGRSPVFDATPGATCSERSQATAPAQIPAYDAILRDKPGDTDALYRRGYAYAAKGDNERALADFEAAIRAGRDDASIHYWRGRMLFLKGDIDGAMADYDRTLALRPDHADALFDRSSALLRKRQYEKTIAGFDEFLRARPNNAQALSLRGKARFMQGDRQGAHADYDAAVHADPDYKFAHRNRGLLLFYEGRYGAAQQDFREWLRLDPDPYAALWLYLARLDAGEDGSAQLFSWEREAQPSKWPAQIVRFHLHEIASEELLAAAAQAGDKRRDYECEARFHIAESRLAAGDREQAAALLRKAAADCPATFDEYFGAQAELKRLSP